MYTSTPSWICLDCWTVWPRLSRYLLIIAPRHITWPLSTLGHWIHGPFEVIPERTGINLQMARSPARLIPLLQLSPYRPKLSITSLPLDSIATSTKDFEGRCPEFLQNDEIIGSFGDTMGFNTALIPSCSSIGA